MELPQSGREKVKVVAAIFLTVSIFFPIPTLPFNLVLAKPLLFEISSSPHIMQS